MGARPRTDLIFVTQSGNLGQGQKFAETWCKRLSGLDRVILKSVLSYGGVMKDPHAKPNPCRVAKQNRFTVAWDGRCTPCNLDVNLAMAAGDMNTQTMNEIIHSEAWKEALGDITAQRGICANCFDAQNHSQEVYDMRGRRRIK